MKITAAKWSGGELRLATADPEAIRFAMAFKAGDYQISKAKKPVTRDARAYAWVLIDKLDSVLRLDKLEVYRNTLRDIGGNTETVCVQEKAYESLKRHWESNGIGWQVEQMPSVIRDCVVAVMYYGISAFDRQEMSVLIDRLVQDCKAVGIETLPEDKLNAMLEAMDGRRFDRT